MQYDEQEDCYLCAAGRKLAFRRESTQRNRAGEFYDDSVLPVRKLCGLPMPRGMLQGERRSRERAVGEDRSAPSQRIFTEKH